MFQDAFHKLTVLIFFVHRTVGELYREHTRCQHQFQKILALPVPTDFSAKIPMKAAGEIFSKRVVREIFTHRA
jgi:hypothetical protein